MACRVVARVCTHVGCTTLTNYADSRERAEILARLIAETDNPRVTVQDVKIICRDPTPLEAAIKLRGEIGEPF